MSTLCHVHVYYKLAEADQAGARLPAFAVLAAGEPWCDRATLTRRTEVRDGMATWMESYENVWDLGALEHDLAEASKTSGLSARLASPRHMEMFQDVPATLDFDGIE